MLTLTVDQLLAFASVGTVWSLALEYFPRLNSWYNALPDNVQRVVVLASGLVVVLGAFGLNCVHFVVNLPFACSSADLVSVAGAYLTFIFSTQATYLVTPKSG